MKKFINCLFIFYIFFSQAYAFDLERPCNKDEACILLLEKTMNRNGSLVFYGNWFVIFNNERYLLQSYKINKSAKEAYSYVVIPKDKIIMGVNSFRFPTPNDGNFRSNIQSGLTGPDIYYWFPPIKQSSPPGNELELCRNQWDFSSTPIGCEGKIMYFDIVQLDPELQLIIDHAVNELPRLKEEKNRLEKEYNNSIQATNETFSRLDDNFSEFEREVESLLSDLNTLSLDEINMDRFNEIKKDDYGLHKLLDDTKKEIGALQSELDKKIIESGETVDKFNKEIEDDLDKANEDIQGVDLNITFNITPISIAPLNNGSSKSNGEFGRLANDVIAKLKIALINNKRSEFKLILYAWIKNQEKLRRSILSDGVSLDLKEEFLKSETLVLDFKKVYLDDNGFFKDIKVSESFKRVIKEDLPEILDSSEVEDFKNEINTWTSTLTENQNEIVTILTDLTEASKKLKQANSTQIDKKNMKVIAEVAITEGLKTAIVTAKSLSNESVKEKIEELSLFKKVALLLTDAALGINPITGVPKNIYELTIGKSTLTGDELTTLDRSFAFVGILTFGGSSFLKFGANLFKTIQPKFALKLFGIFATKFDTIVEVGEGILKSAAKLLGKTPVKEEITELVDIAKAAGGKFDDLSGFVNGKLRRFGPFNDGGPLRNIKLKDGSGVVADTFRSSSYFQNTLEGPIKLYRVYGGDAGKLGSYWSRVKPTGPMQASLDSALDPSWGNSAKKWVEITVPQNTTIFEGFASGIPIKEGTSVKVGELLGGGSQVYIQEVNPSWITSLGGF